MNDVNDNIKIMLILMNDNEDVDEDIVGINDGDDEWWCWYRRRYGWCEWRRW